MEERCRTCLEPNKTLESIFEGNLVNKIYVLAQIEVKDQAFPTKVCFDCRNQINDSYNFRKKIINSHYVLQLLQKNTKTTSEVLTYKVKEEPEDAYEVVKLEQDESTNFQITSSNLNLVNLISSEDSSDVSCTEDIEVPEKKLKKQNKSEEEVKCLKKAVCNVCGKKIRSDNLKKHLLTHSSTEQITCPICKRIFKNAESYRSHPMMHLKESTICEVCGKQFEFKGEYMRHMRGHKQKILSEVCDKCGKYFRDKGQLKRHYQKHTGEKPFECTYCGRFFSTPYALKVHNRKHTLETPFGCHLCHSAFYQRVSLKTHLLSKHSLSIEEVSEIINKAKHK